jgi:hypothetical protein
MSTRPNCSEIAIGLLDLGLEAEKKSNFEDAAIRNGELDQQFLDASKRPHESPSGQRDHRYREVVRL